MANDGGLSERERARFDGLVDRVVTSLPASVRRLIEQVPVVIEDAPDPAVLRELGMDPDEADGLCGLHTGLGRTERGIEDLPGLPSEVALYRLGILAAAGGWRAGDGAVEAEIRVTLLHELGHEMGLEEDDLDELGYG